METLVQFLQGISTLLITLLGLITLQLVLGVLVAIFVNKDFQWKRLSDFLSFYLPRVLAWVGLSALSLIPADVLEVVPGASQLILFSSGFGILVYGTIALSCLGGILSHVQALGLVQGKVGSFLTTVGVPTSKMEG